MVIAVLRFAHKCYTLEVEDLTLSLSKTWSLASRKLKTCTRSCLYEEAVPQEATILVMNSLRAILPSCNYSSCSYLNSLLLEEKTLPLLLSTCIHYCSQTQPAYVTLPNSNSFALHYKMWNSKSNAYLGRCRKIVTGEPICGSSIGKFECRA